MGGLRESREIRVIGLRCGLVTFSASGLLEASALLMHPKISCGCPTKTLGQTEGRQWVAIKEAKDSTRQFRSEFATFQLPTVKSCDLSLAL